MKGLSKLDDDKVRHYETTKETLEKLQCLYGEERCEASEKVDESFY